MNIQVQPLLLVQHSTNETSPLTAACFHLLDTTTVLRLITVRAMANIDIPEGDATYLGRAKLYRRCTGAGIPYQCIQKRFRYDTTICERYVLWSLYRRCMVKRHRSRFSLWQFEEGDEADRPQNTMHLV
jgi:hypothetical protein